MLNKEFFDDLWKYPNLIKSKPRTFSVEENEVLSIYTNPDTITLLDVFKNTRNPFICLDDYEAIKDDK